MGGKGGKKALIVFAEAGASAYLTRWICSLLPHPPLRTSLCRYGRNAALKLHFGLLMPSFRPIVRHLSNNFRKFNKKDFRQIFQRKWKEFSLKNIFEFTELPEENQYPACLLAEKCYSLQSNKIPFL